jgi:hypothetical protein
MLAAVTWFFKIFQESNPVIWGGLERLSVHLRKEDTYPGKRLLTMVVMEGANTIMRCLLMFIGVGGNAQTWLLST